MNNIIPEHDTKATILDSAERLFLLKGFDAVSVRDITDAVGANVAAVNYHFGSKTNLYREVLARRFAIIARQKISLIKRAQERSPAPTLRDVIATFIRSYFDDMLMAPAGEPLRQIIYREMGADALAADLVMSVLVQPIHQAMFEAIRALRPDLSAAHLSFCISSMTGQVVHFIRARAFIMPLSSLDNEAEYADVVVDHITEFSLRGIGSRS